MRHLPFTLALALASLLAAGTGMATEVPAGDGCSQRSAAILANLREGHYADATRDFDPTLRSALPADKLQVVWSQALPAQVGALRNSGSPQVQVEGDSRVVQTPLRFERANLLMRVACDADGRVGGLFFAPAPAGDAPTAAAPPPGVREQPLAVWSPLGPLPGVLTEPTGDGPFPAVVLVAGSGPNDRDETIGPNKPLRDLAQGLARAGIASLRYDKRTLTYGKALVDAPLTVDDEVTDDALVALTELRQQPRIDRTRLFVAGHSLGALMAPRIAARDGHLAGAVLLAAPPRLNLDVVLRQLRYLRHLPGTPPAAIDAQIHDTEAARDALAKADPAHPPAGRYFHAPASWWLSLTRYDAIDAARTLDLPLLVLQGLGDFQVTPQQDFAAWQQAFGGNPKVTLRSYPGLGHLFTPAGDPPSPADYARPASMQPVVIADVARWIKQQPARAGR